MHAPQWSPDGSQIAFSNGWGVSTVKPNGKGRKLVIPDTPALHFHHPYWSHDGNHLVFTGQEEPWVMFPNQDVFTATGKGDNLTNLTNTSSPLAEFILHGYGGGWRSDT